MPPALSHTYVLVVHTRKHHRTSPVMAILAAPTCTRLGYVTTNYCRDKSSLLSLN